MADERRALPIFPAREALLKEFKNHCSCVVVGETGSGKTTQIPQFLYESGFTKKGCIAITQPRRVAAVSIAQRVAQEQGVQLGQEVGYSVRFDDCWGPNTKLKYQTDGMLLREAILDPLLMRYGVVILDEAHERTVHTDVLFGVVKKAQLKRKETGSKLLRIIVMSATLDAENYSIYFNNAKVLYIQGRQYPVQIYYTVKPQQDYLHAAITTVLQLHGEEKDNGDILVFLTGQEEIETAARILKQCQPLFPSHWYNLVVCPLFAALPSNQQQKAFQPVPQGTRKVILSTNIAETSITLPGVKYVVDTGMVKARGYNPLIGLDLLLVQPVSKAQARQRAGRAGREQAGYCYRLYTEESYTHLPETTIPEIQRCNLSSVLLQLLALGVSDILSFEFMDPPSEESLVAALEQLFLLRAVEKTKVLKLTLLGQRMAIFPLDPSLSCSLLASESQGCGEEIMSIVSMLSVESVLYTPHEQRERVIEVRRKFFSEDGDHTMLLKIYRAYKSAKGNRSWCSDNFIHKRNMLTVIDVRKQLRDLCQRNEVPLKTSHSSELVRKALLQGFFMNVAEHLGEGKYQTISTHQEVYIHPSSCLFHFQSPPPYVIYSELVHTTKCYMRTVSAIDANWLFEVAPDYFKKCTKLIY